MRRPKGYCEVRTGLRQIRNEQDDKEQLVKTRRTPSNIKTPHMNRPKSHVSIPHQPSLTPVIFSLKPGRAKALLQLVSAAETRHLNSRQMRASYAVKFP